MPSPADRPPAPAVPATPAWQRVTRRCALLDGAVTPMQSGALVLARAGDVVWATGGACPHRGGPLAEGTLDGAFLRCPWHGALFDLRSGAHLRGPACGDLRPYEVRIDDDWVFVRPPAGTGDPPSGAAG